MTQRSAMVAHSDALTREQLAAILTRQRFRVQMGSDAKELLEAAPTAQLLLCEAPQLMEGSSWLGALKAQAPGLRVVALQPAEASVARAPGWDASVQLPDVGGALRGLLQQWRLATAEPWAPAPDLTTYAPPVPASPPPAAVATKVGTGRASPAKPRPWPASISRAGELAATPLARLLFELYATDYSGILKLFRWGQQRLIYFCQGFVTAVEVPGAAGLGEYLLSRGVIDTDALAKAQELMASSGCNVAEALMGVASLTEWELQLLQSEQLAGLLVDSFAWKDGTYGVEDIATPDPAKLLGAVVPLSCIVRGISSNYGAAELLGQLAPLRNHYLVGAGRLPAHLEAFMPHLGPITLAPLLNGRTTFVQALTSDDAHAGDIAVALYVLYVTGLVHATPEPGAQTAMRPGGSSETTTPVDYLELAAMYENISRATRRLKGSDHFTALGISRDASPAVVEAAYKQLREALRLDRVPNGLSPDLLRQLREVDALLRKIRGVLTDPEQRERYVASLEAEAG